MGPALLGCCTLVFVIVFLAFWPALRDDFVWDDLLNFLDNPHYRGLGAENLRWMFSTFHMGHFQPLSWLSLALDYVWGGWVFGTHPVYGHGMDPRAYHFTNNVLHSANAVLVLMVALRLLAWPGAMAQRAALPLLLGATAAALFFGVHPLRVESVAWATERRDLLSGFFVLLSVLAYLRAQRPGVESRWRWMLIALALFAASLLSKVMAVTLPAVLLILDFWPLQRLPRSPRAWFSSATRRVWLEKVPFFILSLVFSLVASIGQGRNRWLVTLDMHPPMARIMQSLYGLVVYAGRTLWPFDLSPLYQLDFPMEPFQSWLIAAALVVMAAAAALGVLIVKRRAPALVAAAAAYAIMLAPVLGLVQNGPQLVADRYSYLPCIGWAILGGALLAWAWQRPAGRALPALAAGWIALLCVLTWRQNAVWRNNDSLWTHIYRMDPASPFAQNGYGCALYKRGLLDESIELFRRAIARQPTNREAHFNLWKALRDKGDNAALLEALDHAAGIPLLSETAHYERGRFMLDQQNNLEAIKSFEQAIALNPAHSFARTNLGIALERVGRREEAIAQYRAALRIDPNLFNAHYNLALTLKKLGDTAEALEHLRVALRLNPSHAGARHALGELTGASP